MALYMPTDLDARADLLRWAEERLPYADRGFDRMKATPVGVVRDGQLVAVAVYSNRRAATIEASVAADTPRWATPAVIAALIAWPFSIGCRRITLIVASKNRRSKRIALGVGFRAEGRLLDWFPDDDAVIYGLTKADFERSRWRLLLEQSPERKAA